MKKSIMAVAVAASLLLSLGGSALAAETIGGGVATPGAVISPHDTFVLHAGGAAGGVIGSRNGFVVHAGGAAGGVVGSRWGGN